MGLRYNIPFKDYKGNAYEVLIYRADYEGEPTELVGAPSCFVVSGTDEDFIYTPVRTSTATISVIDSELLMDLYSINNQYAAVKLMKNGVLEWTGYIRPEQFTQPYVNGRVNVGVECVSALATLENVEYKPFSVIGTITMWGLMGYLITQAKGEYKGVYIPHVYGVTALKNTNILEEITLIENNFTAEEMNCLEVMQEVCKFLNWTVHDIGGYLYFVDPDWKGEYRLYDETLSEYVTEYGNEVNVQDVGYNGSDGNVLDVVPGYNKARVKAINNVFDDVVKDEAYDILDKYANGDYYIGTYKGDDGAHGVRKQFLKPMLWKLYQYRDAVSPSLDSEVVEAMTVAELNDVYGAVLMREADYRCVDTDDPTPDEGVTDFNYIDSIQIRVADTSSATLNLMRTQMAVTMEGEHAVYADCAISVDFDIDGFFDDDMLEPGKKFFDRVVTLLVECGGMYYNGTAWVSDYTTFAVEIDENGGVKSNRTPFTPYTGISGYVIPMDFFVGKPRITIYCPVWMTEYATHYITGTKIRNLKFGYAKKDGVVDEGEGGDRVYENVVNEAYMSDAEEIEFGISSYNADGATYSKAMLQGRWLTEMYADVVGEYARPEELMIRRIVNRYGVTKIKLTEVLQMTGEITPLTILSERSMANKRFRMTSGEWNYEQNRLTIQMQEDAE